MNSSNNTSTHWPSKRSSVSRRCTPEVAAIILVVLMIVLVIIAHSLLWEVCNGAPVVLAAECAKNHVCSDALSGNPGFSLQLVFELLHAGKLQCNQHLKSPVSSTGLRGALGSFIRDPLKLQMLEVL